MPPPIMIADRIIYPLLLARCTLCEINCKIRRAALYGRWTHLLLNPAQIYCQQEFLSSRHDERNFDREEPLNTEPKWFELWWSPAANLPRETRGFSFVFICKLFTHEILFISSCWQPWLTCGFQQQRGGFSVITSRSLTSRDWSCSFEWYLNIGAVRRTV